MTEATNSAVAPLVGAWIEIHADKLYFPMFGSLLSWERGLKSDIRDVLNKYAPVAPLVGAWIEIE